MDQTRLQIPYGGLNELALFAGACLGVLATSWFLGWKTVCYVERAHYPVKVIKARIRDGLLDDAPIWDDVNTFDGKPWAGLVDVVTAGFPCQPFSTAGEMLGEDDPRNGWPATIRILREVRPRFALLENVPGLTSFPYFGRILGDLAEAGYDAENGVLSAAAVGAPHLRKRLWIVAHAKGESGRLPGFTRQEDADAGRTGTDGDPISYTDSQRRTAAVQYITQSGGSSAAQPGGNGAVRLMADADCIGREAEMGFPIGEPISIRSSGDVTDAQSERRNGRSGLPEATEQGGRLRAEGDCTWWRVEPGVGRVVNGCAHRVDRIAALGNGQVPAVVRRAWDLLKPEIRR